MIYIGSDHRGFALKEKIKEWLKEWGYQYEDMGAFEYNKDDDYPDFVKKAAEKVSQDPNNSRAIVLGATGQGEAMAANRYKEVRVAVFYGPPFQFKKISWAKWLLFGSGYIAMAQNLEFHVTQELIKLSREHNDSNVLSLGAAFIDESAAKKVIKLWLNTPFSNEERHKRRINKIDNVQ